MYFWSCDLLYRGGPALGGEEYAVSDETLVSGSVIAGRYAVDSLIAEGGFGQVFLARHIHLQNRVAIKVIRPEHAETRGIRERFLREARVVAELRHPHIVQIHDLGELDDGSLYLAMEYLTGRELSDRLKEGPLDPAHAGRVLQQVAGALEHAHGKGIVHRDMKPSNIMIDERPDGSVFAKVIDFGILKHYEHDTHIEDGVTQGLTGTTTLLGTPHYMSPEQIKQKPLDPRADQYSLGIIAYEMLGGRKPFNGTTTIDIIVAHVEHPVPDLARLVDGSLAPPGVTTVLEKALAKKPSARHESIVQFANALADALGNGSAPAVAAPVLSEEATMMAENPLPSTLRRRPLSTPSAPQPPKGRGLRWLLAAGVLAIGMAVFLGIPDPAPSPPGETAMAPKSEAPELTRVAAVITPAVPLRLHRPIEDAHRAGPRKPEGHATAAQARPNRSAASTHAPKARSPSASRKTPRARSTRATPSGPPGRLSVIARPTGTISVDGKSHGDVGVRRLKLSAGKHVVRVKGPDGSSRRVQVSIEPGMEYRLLVDLSSNTHKLKKLTP